MKEFSPLIRILDEIFIISYFIQTHRITQNSIPNTDSKFIQQMPCGHKLHNFSTKVLNKSKFYCKSLKPGFGTPTVLQILYAKCKHHRLPIPSSSPQQAAKEQH